LIGQRTKLSAQSQAWHRTDGPDRAAKIAVIGKYVELRRRPLLLLGTALAAFLAFAFRWLNQTEFVNDHFDHVALALQLRLGDLPVRDFVDEGMPLMYVVSAAAWELFTSPFYSETVVIATGFAVAAGLSFRLAATISGSALAAALAVFAQVALNPRTYSYPKFFVHAIALTVAWWAVKRPTVSRLAALAAATALGYYFRHDHAVYLGVASVALLAAAHWRAGLATITRSVAVYGALAALFVLPHLAYVQWAAGIPTYIRVAREYVKGESVGAYRLPVPVVDFDDRLWITPDTRIVHVRWAPGVDDRTRARMQDRFRLDVVRHVEERTWRYRAGDITPADLRELRGDPNVEDTHGFDQLGSGHRWRRLLTEWRLGPGWHMRDNSVALLFWLYWVLPFLGLAMAFGRRRELSTPEIAIVVMMSVLALCSNLVFLRHPLEARLPDVGVSQSVLAAWIGATAWRWWPARTARRRMARGVVAVTTAAALSAVVVFGETGKLLTATGLFQGPGQVVRRWRDITARLHDINPGPVPSYPSAMLLPFIEYVRECTVRDDRLLYGWYSPELTVVTGRGFAGDHRRFYRPLTAWEQAATIAHLQRVRVPFVILPVDRRQWFAETYPDLWRYLQPRYTPMVTIPPDDERGFEILRETSRKGNGVYRTTDWPCLR
jgi:hypothetical protein